VEPSDLDCVGVDTIPLVNELYAMIDGSVCVTLRFEIPLLSPEVTIDRSAGFDPCIYNGHQSVDGSVRNGNDKHFPGLGLKTAKHPLPLLYLRLPNLLPSISTVLLAPPIFSEQPSMYHTMFSAELALVRELSTTEAVLFCDKAGRFAAYGVCEKHNIMESVVSMLKP
jgi:hypothetical protein